MLTSTKISAEFLNFPGFKDNASIVDLNGCDGARRSPSGRLIRDDGGVCAILSLSTRLGGKSDSQSDEGAQKVISGALTYTKASIIYQ